MEQFDIHRQMYKEEAAELLEELEMSLLELEEKPDDTELIGRVFRAMHTIKGSGNMFGFDNIAEFTHDIETVFDMVRDGKMAVTQDLIGLTLAARDQIRIMLDDSGDDESSKEERKRILSDLKKLVPSAKEEVREPEIPVSSEAPAGGERGKVETYRIRFAPHEEIFMTGTNPLFLLEELCELGEYRLIAHTDKIPSLEDINPEYCYTYWNVILTTDKGIDAIKDVFIFAEDECDINIELIDEEDEIEENCKKLGLLIEKGNVEKEDPVKTQGNQKKTGKIPVATGSVGEEHGEADPAEEHHVREVRSRKAQADSGSSIRVPSEKLDILVNLVGELVIVQARLSQTATARADAELTAISEELERLTAELRDNTLNIRMLPIGTTFGKFKRLVRDLSRELDKEVDMITEGAETELDKTVIERLNDPLVHLIRNSIDHGIETPDVRVASGKSPMGIIHLSAEHSGANVLIKIKDDGAGLDRERIFNKAVENGIITPDAELSDKDLFALIFAAGFSTAKEVTNVSGRGVGMDVVKRCIESLGGSIDIESEKGKGTTITLRLPLTLAIIEGLLVTVGEDYFVLPLAAVEECVELTKEDIKKAHGRHIVNVREEIVPYIRIKESFGISTEKTDIEQIVVTRMNGSRIGFVVDQVIGEHQTVIKSLGKVYKNVRGISGATILGDGTVALILDVANLIKDAEIEEVRNSL